MNEFLNYLIVPGCVVGVMLSYMLLVLAGDAIRQWRCRHAEVRLVRQQRGEAVYFAEVCMDCRKASRARP